MAGATGTDRYRPGAIKAPVPVEVEVEGLGSFSVRPLQTADEQKVLAFVADLGTKAETAERKVAEAERKLRGIEKDKELSATQKRTKGKAAKAAVTVAEKARDEAKAEAEKWAGKTDYLYLSEALEDPLMSAQELYDEVQQWTPAQSKEFMRKALVATGMLTEEDFNLIRSRFRSSED